MSFFRTPCILALLTGVSIALGGCGESAQPTNKRTTWEEIAPHMRPAGDKFVGGVVAQVIPLGLVPYDNFSLPIISDDGRFLATQTGAAPSWDMVLARDEAEPPAATQIELYEIIPGEHNPVFVRTIDEPALLGRSTDENGFLIESIRNDGSRWIGHVTWQTGEVRWLVQDEFINAFACLGPGGRLAWSRRSKSDENWRLVIRQGSASFEVGNEGESWLMPRWTGRGSSMFAMTTRGGELFATYVTAASEAAVRQSRRQHRIASEASAYSAYQVLNGQINHAAAPPPRTDRLIYQHPVHMRTVVWSPLEIGPASAIHLHRGSMFALPQDGDFLLVSTYDNLIRQELSLRNPPSSELMAGLQIPRIVGRADMPYVLLSPQAGSVTLTGMQLLDREQLATQSGQ